MTLPQCTRHRYRPDTWRTITPTTDPRVAALVLLAELTVSGVELGFHDGKLFLGGWHSPDDDQQRRFNRYAARMLLALSPLLAPLEWPRTRLVSLDLTAALRGRPVTLDRPVWLTTRQAYPPRWLGGLH